jgi:hypothetical protein
MKKMSKKNNLNLKVNTVSDDETNSAFVEIDTLLKIAIQGAKQNPEQKKIHVIYLENFVKILEIAFNNDDNKVKKYLKEKVPEFYTVVI